VSFHISTLLDKVEHLYINHSPPGAPGSGKTTLYTRLTKNFQVQHVSVSNLLRRIKDDPDHPDSEALAIALPQQKIIPSSILFPIVKVELEEVAKREPQSKLILVDGFPRCLDQQKEFEEKVGSYRNELTKT
jgi:UMP-CMP kinase